MNLPLQRTGRQSEIEDIRRLAVKPVDAPIAPLDGASLAEVGPRIVVTGDIRGGRYVSNVVSARFGTRHD